MRSRLPSTGIRPVYRRQEKADREHMDVRVQINRDTA